VHRVCLDNFCFPTIRNFAKKCIPILPIFRVKSGLTDRPGPAVEKEEPLELIDAHCHASLLVFEPVETLLFQMGRNGVAQAALVQVLGQFDNSYQEHCVARYPDRLANIGAFDVSRQDAADLVSEWAGRGMAGVRIRPEARSAGSDPLALWRAAAEGGLVANCVGSAAKFLDPEFAALTTEFPTMPFVLEQLGGWTRPDCDKVESTWQGLMKLARFPNIFLKVPPLGQIAPRQVGTPLPSVPPVLDITKGAILIEALDAYGADRLMWGSDFPVVGSREGYANALNWTRDLFAARTSEEVAAIFGGTARRIIFDRVG
jgi:L-fuconolactonase